MKLLITDICGCCDKAKVRNDVIFKQWLLRHELFAKFEKFVPYSIIIPSFVTVGSQMLKLDGGGQPPPYKLGSQNTSCKLGLNALCCQGNVSGIINLTF